jgi:hypothetical protein
MSLGPDFWTRGFFQSHYSEHVNQIDIKNEFRRPEARPRSGGPKDPSCFSLLLT